MLNELANQYWTHPHLHSRSPYYDSATPARLGAPSTRAFERLKGLMHFAHLDATLRNESGGSYSLDDCILQVVQRRGASAVGPDAWIGIVQALHPGAAAPWPWYKRLATDLQRNEAPVEMPTDAFLSRKLFLAHHPDAPRRLGIHELSLDAGVVQGCSRRQREDEQMRLLAPGGARKKLTLKDEAYNELARAANADTWENPPYEAGLRNGDVVLWAEGWWEWWGDGEMVRLTVRREADEGAGEEAEEKVEALEAVFEWRPRGRGMVDCWRWEVVDEEHPMWDELPAAARGEQDSEPGPASPGQ